MLGTNLVSWVEFITVFRIVLFVQFRMQFHFFKQIEYSVLAILHEVF